MYETMVMRVVLAIVLLSFGAFLVAMSVFVSALEIGRAHV